MKARIHAARLAARIILRMLWSKSNGRDAGEFLRSALDLATVDLKLTVERVPAILAENQIAGVLDTNLMRIKLATKFRSTSQRFTLAHEFGHLILHPGQVYFRDRELSAPGAHRDYVELEADAFAAEFLMPRNFLHRVFSEMFGGPIDGTIPNPDLADAVGGGLGARFKWTPHAFASLSPLQRACAIASVFCLIGTAI